MQEVIINLLTEINQKLDWQNEKLLGIIKKQDKHDEILNELLEDSNNQLTYVRSLEELKERMGLKKYIYPAVYNTEKKEDKTYYNLKFVDFEEGYTFAQNISDLIINAKEVLGLTIEGRIDDKKEIPKPTKFEDIELKENEDKILVYVYYK